MWEKEIEEMKKAALLAEKKILEVYHSSFKVETKSDDSPVTEADKAADEIIKDYLKFGIQFLLYEKLFHLCT